MTSPTTPYLETLPKHGRRSRHVLEGEVQLKKPKKVNSEIRKQQNRIASRNYREKRKRKLQYLQQLIKDGPNDEQTPEPSPQQDLAQPRSYSTEFDVEPDSLPFMPPLSSEVVRMRSTSADVGTVSVTSTVASDSHRMTATQTCSPFDAPWTNSMYNPPLANTYTPGWASRVDYAPQVAPRQGNYHFSPPMTQAVFEQTTSPYFHSRDLSRNVNHFFLGSSYGNYYGLQSQTYSIPCVSQPTSSYVQRHGPGPH